MAHPKRPGGDLRRLAGNLTVADARHLLHNEGGEISPLETAVQASTTLLIAALTGWALWRGKATAWHLALPMVAQYLAMIAVLPCTALVLRHPALRAEAAKCIVLGLLLAAAAAAAVAWRAATPPRPGSDQARDDFAALLRWVADAGMTWPIAVAVLFTLREVPTRLANLYRYGPPFVGAGLGCGMRAAILTLGLAGLPWLVANGARLAWGLWGALLVADLAALAMHWDIQRKLRRLEGGGNREPDPRVLAD
jgi:hypothetical protein